MGRKGGVGSAEGHRDGSDERHSVPTGMGSARPLWELEVYPIVAPDGGLLVVLRVTGLVSLASSVISWAELEPPSGLQGVPAGRYIMEKIEEVAQQLEDEFTAYGWNRVAAELTQVRLLLARAEEDPYLP
ncbi:hypothetical protein GPA10_08080 [Streptomyces sp. p1417]|uniref:Uncharacterized protein n=1 Tax=Streptomyces typhae TaxID=2681492 RepID=A0A6L6WSQ4_9ACTN|nr:hypothetical protein [Streptomyces typhae]MVO84727.1 hypothetical protein [Streptomyces typhae]